MGHLQYLYFLKHHFAKDQSRDVSHLVCVCVCVNMCVCAQNFEVPNLGMEEGLPLPFYIATLNPSMQMF